MVTNQYHKVWKILKIYDNTAQTEVVKFIKAW